MRRPNRPDRPVLPRKGIVGLFATLASVALLPCGIALADTYTTGFEPGASGTPPLPSPSGPLADRMAG